MKKYPVIFEFGQLNTVIKVSESDFISVRAKQPQEFVGLTLNNMVS